MNEIDDEYKTKEEELDQEITEELETTKNKEKTVQQYLNTIQKNRKAREQAYKKYLEQQKKAIWKKKKKKEKKKPFQHLQVQHFNFSFSTYQKMMMKLEVGIFNLQRELTTKFWKITPNFVLYHLYKAIKEAKRIWNITTETYQETKKNIIEWSIKTATTIAEKTMTTTKNLWTAIKKAFSRLTGKKKEEEGEEKSEEKKEGKEGEETKKEDEHNT